MKVNRAIISYPATSLRRINCISHIYRRDFGSSSSAPTNIVDILNKHKKSGAGLSNEDIFNEKDQFKHTENDFSTATATSSEEIHDVNYSHPPNESALVASLVASSTFVDTAEQALLNSARKVTPPEKKHLLVQIQRHLGYVYCDQLRKMKYEEEIAQKVKVPLFESSDLVRIPKLLAKGLGIADETIQEAFLNRAIDLLQQGRFGLTKRDDVRLKNHEDEENSSETAAAFWSGVMPQENDTDSPHKIPDEDNTEMITSSAKEDNTEQDRRSNFDDESIEAENIHRIEKADVSNIKNRALDNEKKRPIHRKSKIVPMSDLEKFIDSLESFHVKFKGPQHAGRKFVEKLVPVLSKLDVHAIVNIWENICDRIPGRVDIISAPFVNELHDRLCISSSSPTISEGKNGSPLSSFSSHAKRSLISQLSPVLFKVHGNSTHQLQLLEGHAINQDFSTKTQELKDVCARLLCNEIQHKTSSHKELFQFASPLLKFFTDPCYFQKSESDSEINVLSVFLEKTKKTCKTPNDCSELLFWAKNLDADTRLVFVESIFLPYWRKSKDMGINVLTVSRWLEMMNGFEEEDIKDVKDIRTRLAQRILDKGGNIHFFSIKVFDMISIVPTSVLVSVTLSTDDPKYLERMKLTDLTANDITALVRHNTVGIPFLEIARKNADCFLPLQLVSLIINAKAHTSYETPSSADDDKNDGHVPAWMLELDEFERPLVLKLKTMSEQDLALKKKVLVTLMQSRDYNSKVAAFLRNRHIQSILGQGL